MPTTLTYLQKIDEYQVKLAVLENFGQTSTITARTSDITTDSSGNAFYNYRGEKLNVRGYPGKKQDKATQLSTQTGTPPLNSTPTSNDATKEPFDKRLVWRPGSPLLGFSFADSVIKEMVEGVVIEDPQQPGKGKFVSAGTYPGTENFSNSTGFWGVPSMMNQHAYINLNSGRAGGDGKETNRLIVDKAENKRFWYEQDEKYKSANPTTTTIIEWSNQAKFKGKFALKFTDFAFCKDYNKVPNSLLIVLRRYPAPTTDNMQLPNEDSPSSESKMVPICTLVGYCSEENKLSSFLNFQFNLNWKDLEADVWQSDDALGDKNSAESFGSTGLLGSVGTSAARTLAILSGYGTGANPDTQRDPPPDPYNGGPWSHKVQGPIDVIHNTKMRDRGFKFSQKIEINFEYVVRAFGSINSKAILLDLLSNAYMITIPQAPFWGGMNRVMVGNPMYAFPGGRKGAEAFYSGKPLAFFDAVTEQFKAAGAGLKEIFSGLAKNPLQGLKQLLSGGMNMGLAHIIRGSRYYGNNLRSLLTGDPVGEWYLTVGNPLNPAVKIGNLICTGIDVTFSDELGPDGLPLSFSCKVSLEHAMERDRTKIESMYNMGNGRIYSLPKGYETSFSSANHSVVTYADRDAQVKGTGVSGTKSGGISMLIRHGDPGEIDYLLNKSATLFREGKDGVVSSYYDIKALHSGRYTMGVWSTTPESKGNNAPVGSIKK